MKRKSAKKCGTIFVMLKQITQPKIGLILQNCKLVTEVIYTFCVNPLFKLFGGYDTCTCNFLTGLLSKYVTCKIHRKVSY